jgi:carnosine N-methyltransferase
MLANPPISLLDTLSAVDDAIDSNADIADAIFFQGLNAFNLTEIPVEGSAWDWTRKAKPQDKQKAGSTINQLFRDWSSDGHTERRRCHDVVIRDLQDWSLKLSNGSQQALRILVPGAGLGRLVYDIACEGFDAEGNEISYHQMLASNWVMNHTPRQGAFTLYPFATNFTNLVSRDHQLRHVLIPDIHPAETMASKAAEGHRIGQMNMTGADFVVLYSDRRHRESFDAVATVFFIDTAPNLIRYIETVYNCLVPNGIWTNVGPLLWHFDGQSIGKPDDKDGKETHIADEDRGIGEPGSVELTNEEVLLLLERMGFHIEAQEILREGVGYIQNPDALLQNLYM